MDKFIEIIKNLFGLIFGPFHKRKPKCFNINFGSNNFSILKFLGMKKFPLLQLFYNRYISDLNSISLITKDDDYYINDDDLEFVIENCLKDKKSLHIIITRGNVSSKNIERVTEIFWKHFALILILGDQDIMRLKKWALSNNFNACFVYLFMISDGIIRRSRDLLLDEIKKSATELRLDKMGNIAEGQIRTLVKKLEFMLVYEECMRNFSKTCKRIDITRRTFYNWCDTDPVFKELLGVSWEIKEDNKYWYDDMDDAIEKNERSEIRFLKKSDQNPNNLFENINFYLDPKEEKIIHKSTK